MLPVAVLAIVHAAVAQKASEPAITINRLVRSYVSDHHVPGLSVAVIDRGQVILAQGYGLADVENSVLATPDTVYRIASLSKPITATAAMKLVAAGKLDLDAPIQKYCAQFPNKPWPITARQLLSPQSGIRDYRNEEESVNTKHYSSITEALSQFAYHPAPGARIRHYRHWRTAKRRLCRCQQQASPVVESIRTREIWAILQLHCTRRNCFLAPFWMRCSRPRPLVTKSRQSMASASSEADRLANTGDCRRRAMAAIGRASAVCSIFCPNDSLE